VQHQDVRVTQLGDRLDLPLEAVLAQGEGDLGPQHFDGHVPAVLEVPSLEDHGHAAMTEFALDLVPILEGGSKPLQEIHGQQDASKLVTARAMRTGRSRA
jgi:hypothetical protein